LRRSAVARLGSIYFLSFLVACGGGAPPPAVTPPSAPGARCSVAASQDRPLIVEWDAASRNDLDALLKQEGMVVVRYSGCEMELIRDCRAPGEYKYLAATRQDENITMRNEDELWAKLPLGAASLEGAVQKGGQLRIDMSVIGKFVGDQPILDLSRFRGSGCEGATHVVVGLTTGAFEMVSGADAAVSADAVVVGGTSRSSNETLRRAGNRASCEAATRADPQPPEGCGALLRLELEPVRCPPGAQFEAGKGCVGAKGETRLALGGPGGQNDPLDSAFARVLLDASHAVIATVRGEPTPSGMTVEFRQSFDESRKPFQTLGPSAQFLLSECEIGFRRLEPGREESMIVYAGLQVHGDGQLRWSNLNAFEVKEKADGSVPVDQAPAALMDMQRHVVRSLTQESCRPSPAMRREDWAYLLPPISRMMDDGDLPNPKDAEETCAKAAGSTGSWMIDPPECQVAFGTTSQYGVTKIHIVPKPDGTILVKANVWEDVYDRN